MAKLETIALIVYKWINLRLHSAFILIIDFNNSFPGVISPREEAFFAADSDLIHL